MRFILSAEEMREADRRTSTELHVPSAVLMERAAILTAGRVLKRMDSLGKGRRDKVLIVCGPGNNGGDGFACARILMEQGVNVSVLFPGDIEKLSGLPLEQYLSVVSLDEDVMADEGSLDEPWDVIVDAMFGISLSRPLSGRFQEAAEKINNARLNGAFIISIDIPSGVSADNGEILGTAVCADETLVCGFLKAGNVLYPGAGFNGELVIGNIGITEKSLAGRPALSCLEDRDIRLPDRRDYSNKGTYGKITVFAGNENIAGAAVLTTLSALRSGCGMVRTFTHENNRTVLQTAVPEALVSCYGKEDVEAVISGDLPLSEKEKRIEELTEKVRKAIEWSDVIVAGPGLGTDPFDVFLLKTILQNAGGRSLVLDADALNIIALNNELLSECSSEIIITPHLMEMSRLSGIPVNDIRKDLINTARDYASSYHVTVVLKDARTVIAGKDGNTVINLKGNNGMATAGSGDVLTGIIAALLSQGVKVEEAAALGTALHSRAGDRAAEKKGRHALIAGDIIKEIGRPGDERI